MLSEIVTDRCILKPFSTEQIDGLFKMESDPEVHRYLGNKPITQMEQLYEVINFVHKQYKEHGIGRWFVLDKSSHEFLGWSGLKYYDDPDYAPFPIYDLGYRFTRECWGQGYATETSRAWIKYAIDHLNVDCLYATAHPQNQASINVLTKLGFLPTKEIKNPECESNCYQLQLNKSTSLQ